MIFLQSRVSCQCRSQDDQYIIVPTNTCNLASLSFLLPFNKSINIFGVDLRLLFFLLPNKITVQSNPWPYWVWVEDKDNEGSWSFLFKKKDIQFSFLCRQAHTSQSSRSYASTFKRVSWCCCESEERCVFFIKHSLKKSMKPHWQSIASHLKSTCNVISVMIATLRKTRNCTWKHIILAQKNISFCKMDQLSDLVNMWL